MSGAHSSIIFLNVLGSTFVFILFRGKVEAAPVSLLSIDVMARGSGIVKTKKNGDEY